MTSPPTTKKVRADQVHKGDTLVNGSGSHFEVLEREVLANGNISFLLNLRGERHAYSYVPETPMAVLA